MGQPDEDGRSIMRRYGDPVEKRQYTLRPGAYAILLAGDQVLLTHQQDPEPEFQLPGGGIDVGESSICALHREVEEETGWRIGPPKRLGAFRRFVYMPEYDLWAEKVCHMFTARPVRRHGPPTEPGHTAVWAPAAIAPELLYEEGSRDYLISALRTQGIR